MSRQAKESPHSALLGDLESIRSLLDDDADEDPEASLDDLTVPVLQDIVEDQPADAAGGDSIPEPPVGGDSIPESLVGGDSIPEPLVGGDSIPEPVDSIPEPATGGDHALTTPPSHRVGLGDDLFRALLSDEWRESANEILQQARQVIDEHRAEWTPEHTDTLNDALKVRIDATIQGWMRGMVVTHMAELHKLLLQEMSDELRTTIDKIIDQRSEMS